MKTQPQTLIKITIILLLTILTLPIITKADIIQPAQAPPPELTPQQLANTITTENQKTRLEITNYMDKKIDQAITTFRVEGIKALDDDFAQMDKTFREQVKLVQIQFIISIIIALILGNATWYFIRKIITKKEEKRPRYLNLDLYTAHKYGLISEEYLDKITKEDKTIIRPTPQTETPPSPTPPTVNEIEEILLQQKNEKIKKEKLKNKKS